MRNALLFALVLGITSNVVAAEKATAVGRTIDDFSAQDFRGKPHSMNDFADHKLLVVAFLGTECPQARLYGRRLQELADEFADRGVAFLGVDSNRQDSITEIAHYARVYGVRFPILKDAGNVVADLFGAQRTPEVFVLDASRTVRYTGRIDDQYGQGASSGYARTKVARRYLADALTELVEGRSVSEPVTATAGCLIGRVRQPSEKSHVTYANQIARILQSNCVECHRPGQIAPFALTDYDEVVGWADMIAEVVREQRMPPWHANPAYGHFRNDRSLTSEEKELIYEWVANGAPLGDKADLPEPVEYANEWAIPQPDEVVYMSEKPYTVAAEGVLEYQYFVADPRWKEDRWLTSTECRIDNRSVVHHVFVFAVPPGIELPDFNGPDRGQEEFNPGTGGVELIAGAAPGTPAWTKPAGMATHLKAGTRLVFQMHYTPNGREQEDRTAVSFVFCDAAQVTSHVAMNMAVNFGFRIPAGADNHKVEAQHEFAKDTLILNLAPHMHLRGKSFRMDLRYPDGKTETLLEVPRYDFNWQVIYMLDEPKLAPAGSRLYCVAHFDNSDNNLANPDPTTEVRWGDQTWEEMMIGWFSQTSDVDPSLVSPGQTRTARFLQAAQENPPRVGTLVKRAAKSALKSEEDMDKFCRRVVAIVPQVDRVCVSVVDGEAVRFLGVSQSPVLNHPLGRAERTFAAETAALAKLAAADEPTRKDDLTTDSAPDLAAMSAGAASSLHVPVVFSDGRRGTVNFWSKETSAFQEPASTILTDLARLVQTP